VGLFVIDNLQQENLDRYSKPGCSTMERITDCVARFEPHANPMGRSCLALADGDDLVARMHRQSAAVPASQPGR
jgi:hypothetical protein